MKRFIIFLAAFSAIAGAIAFVSAVSAKEKENAGAPSRYIVVFKDSVREADVDSLVNDLERKHGAEHLYSYHKVIKGFAASLTQGEAEKIKNDPRVAFVSEDREVSIAKMPGGGNNQTYIQPPQTTPTGISRISTLSSSSTYKGAGVVIAVIDTGISASHPDLNPNILNSGKSCVRGKTSNDDNGHGSHVAGTIAAADNTIGVIGVAPKAKLIPVKVLDKNGNGTWSSVICGIDWVTAYAIQYKIKIANMSLGGTGFSDNDCGNTNNDALHKAICRSKDAGVTYVVAAGNSGKDASGFVPAAYSDAVIAVSALADSDGKPGGLGSATNYGADDTFADFSNYGNTVALGAPGVNIRSTWLNGSYAVLNGTSMASPHAAGAAALYLSAHPETTTWTQIRDGLKSLGEALNAGHTDPSGLHPEPVVNVSSL